MACIAFWKGHLSSLKMYTFILYTLLKKQNKQTKTKKQKQGWCGHIKKHMHAHPFYPKVTEPLRVLNEIWETPEGEGFSLWHLNKYPLK